MKAPPFRRRVKDAIDVARENGVSVVTITTSDGAAYKFDFNPEAVAVSAEGEANEIDRIIGKWKTTREKAKPKSKIR